jgi:murein DD-endopeptidase MepM/ murein hydrolase activator NlpD
MSRSRALHLAAWLVVAALVCNLVAALIPAPLGPSAVWAADSSLAAAQAELKQAKADLKKLQAKLDKYSEAQGEAEESLESTRIRIEEVKAEIADTEEELAGLREQLSGRLVDMYKNRGSDTISVLGAIFSGDDTSFGEFVDRVAMVSHIAESDRRLVDSVRSELDRLDLLRSDLAQQKAAEQRETAKYEAARDKTLAAMEEAKEEYNALKAKVAKLQAEERRRQEEARRAAAAAAAARTTTTKKSTTATTTKRTTTTVRPDPVIDPGAEWVFPVQGPNSFRDTFGAPRSGGRTHQGCDIMTARNTPIVAVTKGVITRTNPYDTGLGGITIHLRGDDDNVYYYAHLASIKDGIRAGVRVSAGQVIGYAGNTGNASGGAVHLHFEIRPNGGAAINPYPILLQYR